MEPEVAPSGGALGFCLFKPHLHLVNIDRAAGLHKVPHDAV